MGSATINNYKEIVADPNSPKYGYSEVHLRDFNQLKIDAQNGKLQYRGPYSNSRGGADGNGPFPKGETYSEYTVDTPEMNLPAGKVGPERIIMGDQTGDAYYTGSHYEGGNLDIQTGEMLPGEASDLVPEEFFFEFFP